MLSDIGPPVRRRRWDWIAIGIAVYTAGLLVIIAFGNLAERGQWPAASAVGR